MKRIIVNGTFDIVHSGHLRLLNYARSLGDHLTVAIDADSRVKSLKGLDRPVNSQEERRELLLNLKAVDAVEIFSTDSELCDIIKCSDLMVKGSDYRGKDIVGSDLIDIVFFERIDGYSTTEKIQHIISGR